MPETWEKHPAQYSDAAIEAATKVVRAGVGSCRPPVRGLDLMAGVGGIHRMHPFWQAEIDADSGTPKLSTTAVELEPEGTAKAIELYGQKQGRITSVTGDALTFKSRKLFDFIFTSPGFGNRLADRYMGDGTTRFQYNISLGRQLSEGSGASLPWGQAYRELHAAVWANALSLATDDGRGMLIIDIKDHQRGKQWQGVPEWHLGAACRAGWWFEEWIDYPVSSIRFGTNSDARSEVAHLLVFRK